MHTTTVGTNCTLLEMVLAGLASSLILKQVMNRDDSPATSVECVNIIVFDMTIDENLHLFTHRIHLNYIRFIMYMDSRVDNEQRNISRS